MRPFCFAFWRIFDKVWIFFVIVLLNSGRGRSIVEKNHSESESKGLVFFIVLWLYIGEEVSKAIVEPNPLWEVG